MYLAQVHLSISFARRIVQWGDRRHLYRLSRFLASLIIEPIALFRASLLYPFKASLKYAKASQTNKALLFLHGNFHNSGAWRALLKFLKKSFTYPLFSVELPSGVITEKDISQVEEKMKEILKKYPHVQVTLIGHSRGGTVAQLFFTQKKKDFSSHIDKIISLGSPVMEELLRKMQDQDRGRFFDIDGAKDILVQERSSLEGSLLVDRGHIGLLYDREVHEKIASLIG